MPVQVMMGFNATHPGKLQGWTESHYLPSATNPDDSTARNNAVVMAFARVELLGSGVYLNELRLSSTDNERDSVQLPVGESNNPSSAPATPTTNLLTAYGRADLTNVCVRIRMGASTSKWKNLSMAGVPDLLTNTSLKTVDIAAVPLWLTKFNQWKGIIAPAAGGVWGFKGRSLRTGANAPKPIVGFGQETVAPNRIGPKLLTADTGWTAGQKIHIRKTVLLNSAYRSPVGQWTIASVLNDATSGTSTFFLLNSEGININNIKDFGTAELVGSSYFNYTFADILGLGTRKRGVGSNPSRGRRRKKVSKV